MTVLLPLWIGALGVLGVLALGDRRATAEPQWAVALVAGPAVGFGLLSLLYFGWRLGGLSVASFAVAGHALLVAATLAGVLWLRRNARPFRWPSLRGVSPLVLVLLLGAGILAIAAFVLYARLLPHGGFDAWAIWSSRARLLHRGEDLPAIFALLRKGHPDYPLLLPGSLAAQFALAGSESPRIPQWTGALFGVALAGGVALGVRRLGASARWAALAAVLLLLTPKFLYWSAAQCADVPLAYLLLLATLGLATLLDAGRPPLVPPALVGFFVGLLAWTKNEGMPLTALLGGLYLLAALWRRRAATVWPLLLGALPAWLAAVSFRWLWAPQTDLGHFAGDLPQRLLEPQRWRVVADAFAAHLDPGSGFHDWGLVWPFAGLALVASIVVQRPPSDALRFARWALALCWLAWFGVFVGTPADLDWHLRTALDRLLLQLLPLALMVGFAGLEPRAAVPKRPLAALSLILLLGAMLGGCGGGSPPSEIERLIAVQPAERLPLARLTREATAAAWDLDVAAGWAVGPGTATPDTDGLRLAPDARHGRVTLQRDVDLRADAVDVLRFVGPQANAGVITVWWAAAGEAFTDERRERISLADHDGSDVVLTLRGLPGWHGPIGRLRIDYTHRSQSPRSLLLRRLIAARRRVDGASTHDVAARPWRLELDHERRDGFVAALGAPLLWGPQHATGSVLRFGFGTQPAVVGETVFRVVAQRRGTRTVVFEATVGGAGRAAGRWHDTVVEAAAVDDAERFSFEVDYPAAEDQRGALAFWSNPELVPPGLGRRPDILLAVIDTLRSDHLSLYGYERQTSPHLDRWARGAVVFERAVTTSPWTLPAHLSLFSGIDAVRHGVNHRGRVPDDLPLLAATLREAGYATLAVTGGGYLDPDFGLDRGFERYRYWPHHTAEPELAEGVATALGWLAEPARQPLFLFFHTYEVHHPYRPRQPYFERFAPGRTAPPEGALAYVTLPQGDDTGFLLSKQWRVRRGATRQPLDAESRRTLTALYDSGVAFADAQLSRLLARWAERDGASESVVVVTSDHGEALGEKGLAGHAYVEDFNALVPLVLRLPGGRRAGRIDRQVRLTDVAPTLLDLAGLAPPPEADGRSLMALIEGREDAHRPAWTYAAFSNRGLALRSDDRWKYVFNDTAWAPLHGRETLWDLRRDPAESVDLAAEVSTEDTRRQVVAYLRSVGAAVRVRLENRSAEPVAARLAGSALSPTSVKSPGLTAGLERLQPPGALLRAAPGESLELLIESPSGSLVVTLGAGRNASLELSSLVSWHALWTPDGWRETVAADLPKATASLSVDWTSAARATVDPAAENDALRQQLQALGYLE